MASQVMIKKTTKTGVIIMQGDMILLNNKAYLIIDNIGGDQFGIIDLEQGSMIGVIDYGSTVLEALTEIGLNNNDVYEHIPSKFYSLTIGEA